MSYGIVEGKKKTVVEAAQRFNHTVDETVTVLIEMFGGTKSEALDIVKKYWKADTKRMK